MMSTLIFGMPFSYSALLLLIPPNPDQENNSTSPAMGAALSAASGTQRSPSRPSMPRGGPKGCERITFGTNCPQRGTMTGHAVWRAAVGATPAALTLLASTGDSASAFAQGWVFFGARP